MRSESEQNACKICQSTDILTYGVVCGFYMDSVTFVGIGTAKTSVNLFLGFSI